MRQLSENVILELLRRAREVRGAAYSPYSCFKVGAALLCDDDDDDDGINENNAKIFTGCNVENISFGATNCAERTAVFSAVAAGHRKFRAIAVAAGDELILPCGVCRQVLAEFSPEITVICGKKDGYEIFSLNELLPHGFSHF